MLRPGAQGTRLVADAILAPDVLDAPSPLTPIVDAGRGGIYQRGEVRCWV